MKHIKKTLSIVLSLLLFFSVFSTAYPVFAAQVNGAGEPPVLSDGEDDEPLPEQACILGELTALRTENGKTFRLSNGSRRAVTYPVNVHFRSAENGFTEYDNTLTENKNGMLAPAVSDFDIQIAKQTGGDTVVRAAKDGYTLTWTYVNAAQSTAEVSAPEKDDDPETVDALTAEVRYKNVFKDTDLQYILTGANLKENILLSSNKAPDTYTLHFSSEGLTPYLSEDGRTILLKNGDGIQIFALNAPYAQDAAGETCTELTYKLANVTAQGFDAELHLNNDWLADPERSFPVVIDPVLFSEQIIGPAYGDSAYIASGTPSATYGYGGNNYVGNLYAGYSASKQIMRGLIKFTLPDLGIADRVVSATMHLFLVSADDMTVQLHKVTGSWAGSTVCWNNRPAYQSNVISEFKTFNDSPSFQFVDFDITKLTDEWYAGGANNGLMITSANESTPNSAQFYSTEYTGDQNRRPILAVDYRNTSGYEDYYSYESLSAGRGGSADVNVYNGNLVCTQSVTVDNGGSRLPVNLSLIYNANKGYTENGLIGYGWKLNYQQFIRPNPHLDDDSTEEERKYKYYYEDGDGTQHYFYFSDLNGNTGVDEDGLGFTLTVNTSVSTTNRTGIRYTITTKTENKLEFNGYGNLLYMRDTNNNCIALQYDSATVDNKNYERLKKITDGAGREYSIVYYGAWPSYINFITDPAGRVTNFSTTSSLLRSIVYSDDKTVSYGYTSSSTPENARLNAVTNIDGVQTTASYTTGLIKRVSEIKTVSGSATAARYAFAYGQNATAVTDIAGLTCTYQFDTFGHATGVVSEDSGEALAYGFEDGNSTSPKANKLKIASRVQKSVDNYLKNPSFHVNAANYSVYKSVPADASSWSYDANYGHYAAGSLHVSQPAGASGYIFGIQPVYAPPGTYTVSAYVSTKNVAIPYITPFLCVEVRTASAHVTSYNAECLGSTGVNRWVRQTVTLTITQGQYFRVLLGFGQGTMGEVWFDDIQVETGAGVSAFNILENPQFRTGVSSVWTPSDSSITIPAANTSTNAMQFAVVPGNMAGDRTLSQTVKFSGQKGQVFSFGAWVQANSTGTSSYKIFNDYYKARFRLRIDLMNGTSSIKHVFARYNPYVSDLQFISATIAAETAFTHVKISFGYGYNANTALLSGVYCLAEEYGRTFTYDKNGDLISSVGVESVDNAYGYGGGRLTSAQAESRSRSFAGYAGTAKNLANTVNTENQLFTYSYDACGNLTQANVRPANFTVNPQAGHTYYILNAESGMALGKVGSTAPHDVKNKYFTTGQTTKQWQLEAGAVTGEYYLRSAANNTYLRINTASNSGARRPVIADQKPASADQTPYLFRLQATGEGSFLILTKTSAYSAALDSRENILTPADEGDPVYQYSLPEYQYSLYDDRPSQYWYFFEVGGGTPYMQTNVDYSDDHNFAVSVTDANGNTADFEYNSAKGWLTRATDGRGLETTYTYNSMSQPTGVTRYALSAGYAYTNDLLTRITASGGTQYNFIYDAFGRPTQTKANNITLAQTEYDNAGRVSATYDAAGNDTAYTYDPLDRLSTVIYNSKQLTYYYGADGRLAQTVDTAAGTHTKYVYDLAGRRVQTREYAGTALTGNTLRGALEYTYTNGTNQVGAVTTRSALGANTLDIHYGNLASGQSADYVYSEDWNEEGAKAYQYDTLGRLKRNITKTEVLSLQNIYTYRNINSSRTTAQVSSLQTPAGTYTYTYDANGNILSETCGGYTTTYAYNEQDMLVRENNQRANKTYLYEYEHVLNGDVKSGNLLSRTTYAYTTGVPGTPQSTDTYTYGSSAWGDLLTAYNNQIITYDDAVPSTYRGCVIDWYQGGLISRYYNDADAQYTYDVSGRRLTKKINNVTTTFIYAGDMLLGQQTGSNKLAFMFSASGDVYGFTYNDDKYFYVKNLQGDVIALANVAGDIIAYYYYDAWGRLLNVKDDNGVEITDHTDIAHINPIRYRSYYYDIETGFYFLNSRYYDPEVGRFISADDQISALNPADMNLFAYCGNNPVIRFDPQGNDWEAIIYTGLSLIVFALSILAALPTGGASLALADLGISPDTIAMAAKEIAAIGFTLSGSGVILKASDAIVFSKNSQERDYQILRNNKQANNIAQKLGEKNAEALKQHYTFKHGAKFNMAIDRTTGELVLIGIADGVIIETGCFPK